MAVINLGEEPRRDGIDLDRVIVDPAYRRRVIDRLRAEAQTRSPPPEPEAAPEPGAAD
ncbi:MAG TPA: hypothetical protein VE397_01855 [Stellaceae bacterium]|jgi:hypothetical protein|nr:hypothetical protein [Stellaceae bacterium]